MTTAWRIRSSRTYGGVLSICLNYGIDPPDCPVLNDAQVWLHEDPRKVVAAVGRELEQRFVHLHGSRMCAYRQCLDPTSEQVQRTCRRLRRDALEDNLVLYYSGHGVPSPSILGELWFFNETYTEYVPARVVDVASWLGAPRLMIFDCPCSERVISMLGSHFGDSQRQALEDGGPLPLVALGATSMGERLPIPGVFPADVFTACLTKPLEMAIQMSMQRSARSGDQYGMRAADVLSRLPGTLGERRSPLGELNWVLTAITDAIAWALLPQPLFSRLFRQDVTLSAMLRNFVLAARVMWHLQCHVVSEPRLPACHEHPLWDQWDHTVDLCFVQLQGLAPRAPAGQVPTPFFADQLTAFKLAIDLAAKRGAGMEAALYLPVVLQALLSQSHRMRAMGLLRGFLCLGLRAVQRVLDVGIFQYLAKLLNSSIPELRSTLLHIWALLLSHDSSCQTECFKANGHLYFVPFLPQADAQHGVDAGAPKCEERVLAFLVYGSLCKDYRAAQHACLGIGLVDCCGRALASSEPLERRWALNCLTQLVWCNQDAALAVCADALLLEVALCLLHGDRVAEVRGAAAVLVGTLLGTLAPGGIADAALASAPELLRRHGELHSAAESAWHGSASRPPWQNCRHAQFRCSQSLNEPVVLQVEMVVRRLRDGLLTCCADVSPTVRRQLAHVIGHQFLELATEPQRLVQRCLRLHSDMAVQCRDSNSGGGRAMAGGGVGVARVGGAAQAVGTGCALDELTVASLLCRDASPVVRQQMVGPPVSEHGINQSQPGQSCDVSEPKMCGGGGGGGSVATLVALGAAIGQHETLKTRYRRGAFPVDATSVRTCAMVLSTPMAHTHAVAVHTLAPLVVGICGADRLVCTWDLRSGARVNCFPSPCRSASGLELLTLPRQQLLLAHHGGVVQQWSDFESAGSERLVSAWNALPEPREAGGSLLLSAHHGQQLLLTAGSSVGVPSTMRIWDLDRTMCVWAGRMGAARNCAGNSECSLATSLCLDPLPGGRLMCIGGADGSLALYDHRAAPGAAPVLAVRVDDVGAPLTQLAMLGGTGGGHVVVSLGTTVRCTDTRTGKVFLELATSGDVSALACHQASGQVAVSSHAAHVVQLHDLTTWMRAALRFPSPDELDAAWGSAADVSAASCMAFSPCGSYLARGGSDNCVVLFRCAAEEFRRECPGMWRSVS